MGYLNKTCSAGTTSSFSYGPTLGPILRGAAEQQWAQWTFTVVGESREGHDLVTIETMYPGRRKPLLVCRFQPLPALAAAGAVLKIIHSGRRRPVTNAFASAPLVAQTQVRGLPGGRTPGSLLFRPTGIARPHPPPAARGGGARSGPPDGAGVRPKSPEYLSNVPTAHVSCASLWSAGSGASHHVRCPRFYCRMDGRARGRRP